MNAPRRIYIGDRRNTLQLSDKVVLVFANETTPKYFYSYEFGTNKDGPFFYSKIFHASGVGVNFSSCSNLIPTKVMWNETMKQISLDSDLKHSIIKNRHMDLFYHDEQIAQKLGIFFRTIVPKTTVYHTVFTTYKSIEKEFETYGLISKDSMEWLNKLYKSYSDKPIDF